MAALDCWLLYSDSMQGLLPHSIQATETNILHTTRTESHNKEMAIPAVRLTELMSEASENAAKLPVALISCGVALAAAALSLLIFKVPGGILLRLHGSAPVLLFYGSLVAVATFGLVEASFGYWLRPRDHDDWRAVVGKAILWFSILPLVFVVALGGAVSLK